MDSYKNNIADNNAAGRPQAPIMARTATQELTDDFSLPDYKPEIRRLISVTASVSPAAHYLTTGHAEFAGTVRYCIRYEGGDGGVWSAELPSEYDLDLTTDNDPSFDTDGAVAYADVVCDSVNARVTAPRRLSIRTRVRADAAVLGRRTLDDVISGQALPESDIRRLTASSASAVVHRGTAEASEYSDTFMPDDGGEGEIRVICCRAEPFVSEAALTADGVSVRGEIFASVLLCRESEGARPFAAARRIPFVETVAADGDGGRTVGCRAWGDVTSEKAEPDGSGGIVCSFETVITAEVLTEENARYTADIYSSSHETASTMRQCDIPTAIKSFNANMTVSGGAELSSLGADAGMRVVDAWAEALPPAGDKSTEDDAGFRIAGRLRVRALLDDGANMTAKEFEIPFRYEPELPAECMPFVGGGYSEWRIGVPVCRVRLDGERLAADCEVTVAARLCGREKLTSVAETKVEDARAARRGSICVYYPTSDDTLWSVAKRYGTDTASLAASNGIDPAAGPTDKLSACGVKFVIV